MFVLLSTPFGTASSLIFREDSNFSCETYSGCLTRSFLMRFSASCVAFRNRVDGISNAADLTLAATFSSISSSAPVSSTVNGNVALNLETHVNQSINQARNQSTNQSINQAGKQASKEAISQQLISQ